MKSIFFTLFSLQMLIGSSNAQSIGEPDFRVKAFEEAAIMMNYYRDYTRSFENSLLIKGVKSAAKSSLLLELWLADSSNTKDVKMIGILKKAIARLCGDIAEDLVISSSPEREAVIIYTYLAKLEIEIEKITP